MLYTRKLNLPFSFKHLKFSKHWGLVIEYLDEDRKEGLPKKFIYHAEDVGGNLIATFEEFTSKFTEDYEGVDLTILEENAQVSKVLAESFCKEFSSQKSLYITTQNNCQTFANELHIQLKVSSSLPLNSKNFTESSLKSSQSIGMYLLSDCLNNITSEEILETAKKQLSKIPLIETLLPTTEGAAETAETLTTVAAETAETLTTVAAETAETLTERTTETLVEKIPVKQAGKEAIQKNKMWLTEDFGKWAFWRILHFIVEHLTEKFAKSYLFQDCSKEKKEAFSWALSKAVGLSMDGLTVLLGSSTLSQVFIWWLASLTLAYLIEKVTLSQQKI
jgi:hypothetical protein